MTPYLEMEDVLVMGQHHDRELELELVEHALLLAYGWVWGAHMDEFFWKKPPWHASNHTYYSTRGHAINSLKKRLNGRPTRGNRDPYDY